MEESENTKKEIDPLFFNIENSIYDNLNTFRLYLLQ